MTSSSGLQVISKLFKRTKSLKKVQFAYSPVRNNVDSLRPSVANTETHTVSTSIDQCTAVTSHNKLKITIDACTLYSLPTPENDAEAMRQAEHKLALLVTENKTAHNELYCSTYDALTADILHIPELSIATQYQLNIAPSPSLNDRSVLHCNTFTLTNEKDNDSNSSDIVRAPSPTPSAKNCLFLGFNQIPTPCYRHSAVNVSETFEFVDTCVATLQSEAPTADEQATMSISISAPTLETTPMNATTRRTLSLLRHLASADPIQDNSNEYREFDANKEHSATNDNASNDDMNTSAALVFSDSTQNSIAIASQRPSAPTRANTNAYTSDALVGDCFSDEKQHVSVSNKPVLAPAPTLAHDSNLQSTQRDLDCSDAEEKKQHDLSSDYYSTQDVTLQSHHKLEAMNEVLIVSSAKVKYNGDTTSHSTDSATRHAITVDNNINAFHVAATAVQQNKTQAQARMPLMSTNNATTFAVTIEADARRQHSFHNWWDSNLTIDDSHTTNAHNTKTNTNTVTAATNTTSVKTESRYSQSEYQTMSAVGANTDAQLIDVATLRKQAALDFVSKQENHATNHRLQQIEHIVDKLVATNAVLVNRFQQFVANYNSNKGHAAVAIQKSRMRSHSMKTGNANDNSRLQLPKRSLKQVSPVVTRSHTTVKRTPRRG